MDDRIRSSMRKMEQRISEEPDFAGLADAAGLSRCRFYRLFLDQVGETPGSYLRRIRLDLAAMRLRWTRESVGEIAHGLGYRSQSSFNKAFIARFGETPTRFRNDTDRWPNKPLDKVADRRIRLQHSEGFICIAKRYLGPYSEVPGNWTDFRERLATLSDAVHSGLFLGLTYDDPRFTPANQIRYDCCIVVGERPEGLNGSGFHLLSTRPGLYAAASHAGRYEMVGSTYSLVLDNWVADSRYTMADDPAVEVYSVPPDDYLADDLRCTIMVPLL